MDTQKLARLLFPRETKSLSEWEAIYPKRDLPRGAAVTRFAPSPTGFVHVGSMFPIIVNQRLSRSSGGIMLLRLEDTDSKREISGAAVDIIQTLAEYGIVFDEGVFLTSENKISEKGCYSPYFQQSRKSLYTSCARHLVEQGYAYPCFCSEDALSAMRQEQQSRKDNLGYFGKWASCRNLSLEDIQNKLAQGQACVLRLKSPGNNSNKIVLDDLCRGQLEMPENDIDHVLLKSDGIPTYHFAHAADDHFMRVTHVVRGDEWLATYPLHHQLFGLLGFDRPKYIHLAPLMKAQDGSKRKLSKRKDPEAALRYYSENGFPKEALQEYISILLNSDYDDWRRANPDADAEAFPFSVKKLGWSGSLFDMDKLLDVSRGVIAGMTACQVYNGTAGWAERFDQGFHKLFTRNRAYSERILSIGRGGKKPRKDIATWKDVPCYISFFFPELFSPREIIPVGITPEDYSAVLSAYAPIYDTNDEQGEWFQKIKDLGASLGFCPDVRTYKKCPENWKGSVADVCMVLRTAVTGRENSPDLYECMRILGKAAVLERINHLAVRK
ncbi:MAG: glutamate--tRNA ligase family protein [Oscillospiraceae bacterium]|nr:glutamate--tRNA ligase family protein [Oscillospiraceae bacterium]